MNSKTAKAYRSLKDSGADIQKANQIRFNSGSETSVHVVAKSLVGQIALQHGYRVSSEVEVPEGEIDVCMWGHPKRLTYAVELEHSPTLERKQDKLNRYVRKVDAIDDMVLINLNDLSMDILKMRDEIKREIGL